MSARNYVVLQEVKYGETNPDPAWLVVAVVKAHSRAAAVLKAHEEANPNGATGTYRAVAQAMFDPAIKVKLERVTRIKLEQGKPTRAPKPASAPAPTAPEPTPEPHLDPAGKPNAQPELISG